MFVSFSELKTLRTPIIDKASMGGKDSHLIQFVL